MTDDPFEEELARRLRGMAHGAPRAPAPIDDVVRRGRRIVARRRGAVASVSAAMVVAVATTAIVLSRPSRAPDARTESVAGGNGGQIGIDASDASPNLSLIAALEPFDSCDALLRWIKAEAGARVGPYGFGARPGVYTTVPASAAPPGNLTLGDQAYQPGLSPSPVPPDGAARDAAGGAIPQVSGTNVQEAGVDEPDIVKTDGRRIVTLVDGRVATFTVDGGVVRPAGSVELPAPPVGGGATGNPRLLLAGDRVLVLQRADVALPIPAEPAANVARYSGQLAPRTVLTQVDIADLAHPRLGDTLHVDGAPLDARQIGSTVRIVISSTPSAGIGFVAPSLPGNAESEAAATEANRKVVEETTIEDWVPGYRRGPAYTTAVHQATPSPLLDCTRVRHPKAFSGLGTVSVLTVDLGGALDPAGAVGVLATGERIYASATNLYVATRRAPDPAPAPNAPGSAASPGTAPGTAVPTPPSVELRTAIHKFDLLGAGPAVYRASGEVGGVLLNDFAMSEHDGHLRAATTTGGGFTGGTTESAVVVLAERDGELQQVGAVGGLGRGEQIRAVRFLGRIGYVVTFRQTDPLYTIDLADPRQPRVAGELKIPGYSAYLHPVGDGLLLGVGQDATEQGIVFGMQVALFDVSDLAEPTQVSKLTVPYASSEAERDYHAFLWWAPTATAIIPVDARGERPPFTGAIGYAVAPGSVSERGRVVNPVTGMWCPPGSGCVVAGGVTCEADGACAPPAEPIGEPILRSLVIGDALVTLSRGGLHVSDVATLAAREWVPFR